MFANPGRHPLCAAALLLAVAAGLDAPLAQATTPLQTVLSGDSDGAANDELQINGPRRAEGATVKLWRCRDGDPELMENGTLNSEGNRRFRVADENGKKFTKYFARVIPEDSSSTMRTNNHRVR